MPQRRSLIATVLLAPVVAVGVAAADASGGPSTPIMPPAPVADAADTAADAADTVATTGADVLPVDPEPDLETDPSFAAFWAEVDRSGLVPIGQNADGTGPYGWVEYERFVVVDGEPHDDLEIYDADGVHIGWVVHGLPPLTIEEYERDPAGHRAAGLQRYAEFEAAAADLTDE
jgi:hypothetical protein